MIAKVGEEQRDAALSHCISVSYFDGDWVELEHLSMKEVTFQEALSAVYKLLLYRHLSRHSMPLEERLLSKVHAITLEVHDG
jgi:hypothetical protein